MVAAPLAMVVPIFQASHTCFHCSTSGFFRETMRDYFSAAIFGCWHSILTHCFYMWQVTKFIFDQNILSRKMCNPVLIHIVCQSQKPAPPTLRICYIYIYNGRLVYKLERKIYIDKLNIAKPRFTPVSKCQMFIRASSWMGGCHWMRELNVIFLQSRA